MGILRPDSAQFMLSCFLFDTRPGAHRPIDMAHDPHYWPDQMDADTLMVFLGHTQSGILRDRRDRPYQSASRPYRTNRHLSDRL